MQDPEAALQQIAEELRREHNVISSHVVDSAGEPVLGLLAAAGPRAAPAPGQYAIVVEAIREGYELHYGSPRILAGQDDDLALLAGDYLYALGLERLAAMRDSAAVAELSDLISLCAACHAEDNASTVPALWIAAAVAVGCGGGEAHEAAKAAARSAQASAAEVLLDAARESAASAGLDLDLDRVGESIDLALARPADSG
jgi:hypothetical protein